MDTHGEIQPEEMEEGSHQSERSAVTSTPGEHRARPDDYNRTSLHMAAWKADVDGVRVILETLRGRSVEDAQAVVNAQDHFGFTPLHLAVRGGRPPKRMLLEEVEGSVETGKDREETKKDREEVVRILTTSSWMLPDRYITAASERDETDRECGRYTPLHLAARAGSIQIVKLLLRQPLCRGDYKGCDPINLRATTWEGHTPLAMAYKYQHFDVAELLKYSDLSWLESERAKLASSINAIMVGATLIAAATFGAWRQPPLGIPEMKMPNPASDEVAHNFEWRSQASTICYAYIWYAFILSVVALLMSILTTTPAFTRHLKAEVKRLRKTVNRASCLLYFALLFFSSACQLFGVFVLDTTSTSARHRTSLIIFLDFSIYGGSVIIGCLVLFPLYWRSTQLFMLEARNQVQTYREIGHTLTFTILGAIVAIVQYLNLSLILKTFHPKDHTIFGQAIRRP